MRAMEMELDALAGKLDRVVALLERLQSDNASLKQRIATLEAERDVLQHNMSIARARVENLIARLPEDLET